uniref:Matrix protein n=1 Tax=Measles virus (strain Yamagata-1) TaxID=11239 RepID=MATRX_MEASY|nr:RecName: Full=Matrix protein [Measles virus strain Yamagata-1]pir/B60285/ matrix protein - subacute sclerosing panencephalitis virus (strain Yamagata-1) [Measles morbillivirus]
MHMFPLGVVEDSDPPGPPIGRASGSPPPGAGRSTAKPEELLKEATEANIVVRRTAGLNEKLAFHNNTPPTLPTPRRKAPTTGSVLNANQACNAVNLAPLDTPQRFRAVYMSITRPLDNGYYTVPRRMLEFRSVNAVAFNLLVTLRIDKAIGPGKIIDNAEQLPEATFMVHIGDFRRKKSEVYSADYCKMKIEKMGLVFALGGIGGTSLHTRSTGKMSKTLHAQLGFKKTSCYPPMDINEDLNRLLWRSRCKIVRIQAVLQPSVPQELRIYDDVIINDDQGVFKVLQTVVPSNARKRPPSQ